MAPSRRCPIAVVTNVRLGHDGPGISPSINRRVIRRSSRRGIRHDGREPEREERREEWSGIEGEEWIEVDESIQSSPTVLYATFCQMMRIKLVEMDKESHWSS